ncbi:MAG: ClpXP protease specificity-enhancing factor [bacterium]
MKHDSPAAPRDGSIKPYLLRAIYQWALDHGLTPQLLVDARAEQVAVPRERVENGRIVLTIHPQAIAGLDMGDHHWRFSARFGGAPFAVNIPVAAVAAIYCRENGQGIFFHADGSGQTPPASPPVAKPNAKPRAAKQPAHLKLVK